jgi:hypothetical protein
MALIRPWSIRPISSAQVSNWLKESLDIHLRISKRANRVMVSYSEPRAMNKKWVKSYLVLRPFPSAMFIGMEVAAASNCSTRRKCFRSVSRRSVRSITALANSILFCHTCKSLYEACPFSILNLCLPSIGYQLLAICYGLHCVHESGFHAVEE